MDSIIIGGGASGLAASIEASKYGHVRVLERGSRVGRKLALTGNGRCNLTNLHMGPERYHGSEPDFTRPALERFGVEDTLAFFRLLGLLTLAEPSGRVYPLSDQAGSVVDVLRFAALERGAELICNFSVREIRRERGGFLILSDAGSLRADRVIVAAGGEASPRAGGTDAGYLLLERLGHTRTRLYPSLVQLRTENSFTRPLKGVRADAGVEVLSRGKVAAASGGEVQFTDYGLSGPAVFEVSRAAVTAESAVVRLDLLRALTLTELTDMLERRRDTGLTAENLLTGILHNKIGRTLVTRLGWPLATPLRKLDRSCVERAARAVKRVEMPVTGNMGMEGAQVTAGGIRTAEFDPETLESRVVPGLFACGTDTANVVFGGEYCFYNPGSTMSWALNSGRMAAMEAWNYIEGDDFVE